MSRFAKHHAPYQKICGWFNRALDRTDPKPSAATLDGLARQLQILLNRADNAELQRAGPVKLSKLKDVSPAEHLSEKAEKIERAAVQMLVLIDQLEAHNGNYIWPHPSHDVTLEDVRELLLKITFFAFPQRPAAHRGQPPVPWRDAGRKFALAVKAAMHDAGYKGRLGIRVPESVTVMVAAAAINWAYEKPLLPSGFVSAMRGRDRKKKRNTSVLNRRNKDRRNA